MSVISTLKSRLSLKADPLPKKQTDQLQNFEAVYDQYHVYVRRTHFWIGGSLAVELLDELVQETFIKIWKALPGFQGRSSIKTWVYRICVNVAIDAYRSREAGLAWKSEPESPLHMPFEERLDVQKAISIAMSRLSEKQRVPFVLYYKEDLELNEISKVLDIPVGTVKSRLHQARSHFAQSLQELGVNYES